MSSSNTGEVSSQYFTSAIQNNRNSYQDRSQQRPTGTNVIRYGNKRAIELSDTDQKPYSWHYTSTSGAKRLENISDAHHYIDHMKEIWRVPYTIQADEFIVHLHETVDGTKKDNIRDFFITDNEHMIIHLVVGIRSSRGGIREIYFCMQQVTDSSASAKVEQAVGLVDKPTVQWMREKARERLGMHQKAISVPSLYLDKFDGPHINYNDADTHSTGSFTSNCQLS